ncbi:hypothetical protein DRN73_04000 [Candidatus Pacearchaeota archaeon]|nr:MAG: hypothetical protein DRN73_04000 [Candidatus Pacearchaeota archaeon]
MAEKGDYTINNIYQGGYSALEPNYGDIFTGYHVAARELGAPTKPDTANQIQQVNMLLNQGIIPIEVGALSPEVFDQIPKQHFKEINRMAKLAGAEVSVHAPIIEASGITDQGWSESERQLAENQLKNVIDRTAPLNEKGQMSITIHGAGKIPGAEYEKTPEGKKETAIYVVNSETGKITTTLREEKKFYLSTKNWEEGTVLSPKEELEQLNSTEWSNSLSQLMHHKEDADARIKESLSRLHPEILNGLITKKISFDLLKPEQKSAYSRFISANQFLTDAGQNLSSMFNKAYKFGTERDRELLKKAAEEYKKDLSKGKSIFEQLTNRSNAMQKLASTLEEITPQIYKPVEEFALEKSATTFANVAFHGFKKYKDKAPLVDIENLFPGMAFSYGKELKNLIEETRKKFVERAIKEGYSKSVAESQANKLIGITLDVGHINIAKKKGFTNKDILKEVNEIAKYVKHVHLTDNFGYSDSHLPPGMGNVPFKEILERLEKEGYKGKKIVEAGGFVQHFGASPLPYTLQAMGSPIFAEGEAPYWNQTVGLYQGYSGGFGNMLPQINYETFGAGFSQLPAELGGERPGAKGSRMSGKPME